MEETSAATHLPEVDAMPDGFVTESVPASTADSALEKSSDKCNVKDCSTPEYATLEPDSDDVGAADCQNVVDKSESVMGDPPLEEIEQSLETGSENGRYLLLMSTCTIFWKISS